MASSWVKFRDWFCVKILPLAIGVLATTLKNQAEKIPGLLELIGLIKPLIQSAYDKAVAAQDMAMQAILLAVLSKLFLMELVVPGVEVLDPADADKMLLGWSKETMDAEPEDTKSWWQKFLEQEAPDLPADPEGN